MLQLHFYYSEYETFLWITGLPTYIKYKLRLYIKYFTK